MKNMKKKQKRNLIRPALALGALSASVVALAPTSVRACACGCGVFDVGTSSMFPTGAGGMAFLNYDYQDQNRNWSGTSSADAANNDDKKIETHFVTLGLQYMFNRSWGAELQLPFDYRNYKGVDDDGNPVNRRWETFGDIRLKAIYTGFSEDLSSGLTLGVKLPTGSISRDADAVDRDTQIGTGSTDILFGGFHRARFGSSHWNWFGQAELDLPVLKSGDYRPGLEVDAAAGVYYDGLSLGRVQISPVAQVIGSWRGRDNGAAADADNTGYQRVLLSPGIEFHLHPVKFYADVEIPVYQNMTGNQLVASALFKVNLSFMF
jgi:hypothetical protein